MNKSKIEEVIFSVSSIKSLLKKVDKFKNRGSFDRFFPIKVPLKKIGYWMITEKGKSILS